MNAHPEAITKSMVALTADTGSARRLKEETGPNPLDVTGERGSEETGIIGEVTAGPNRIEAKVVAVGGCG